MLIAALPPLPAAAIPWTPSVQNSVQRLNTIYITARTYIDGSSLENHRLQTYFNSLVTDAFPILVLLEESADELGIPLDWFDQVVNLFIELCQLLEDGLCAVQSQPTSNVQFTAPIYTGRTGKRGRPKKIIDPAVLQDALGKNRRITVEALSNILGVHRNTLRAKVRELEIDKGYDRISDGELDNMIREYRMEHPDSGRSYISGYIRSKYGLRLQRSRIVESMARVDRLQKGLRQHVGSKKKHQAYSVPRPNALWHIDGHHKLILWGIVLHGVADGFGRKVTGLRASSNNSAKTSLEMFVSAIQTYGVPSRVRGDRGGENRDVSILMILLRGPNRASFMWGSSVFNTRIERLWVEVGKRFGRAWRAFFVRLGRLHLLNRKNKAHLWLLHFLFLHLINEDCDKFREEWNDHPIQGPAGGNMSPNDMTFLGELKYGKYEDPLSTLSTEEVNRFYGFQEDGEPLNDEIQNLWDMQSDDEEELSDESDLESDSSGSSISEDTSSSDSDQEHRSIINNVEKNIHHDPVPVPPKSCPFTGSSFDLFKEGLRLLRESGDIPKGYGIDPSEWSDSGYPTTETITVGLRKKSYPVSLPDSVWRPRAEDWVRGLYVMDMIVSQQLN